jgi:hypothetical protein
MGTDADEDRERMAAQASEVSHDLAREIYKVIHKHSPEFIEHGDEEVEEIERLIQAKHAALERKLATLRRRLTDWESREASVCPEDVGCDEFITILRVQVEALKQALHWIQERCDRDAVPPAQQSDQTMYRIRAIVDLRRQIADTFKG